jgi:hypothetical protein
LHTFPRKTVARAYAEALYYLFVHVAFKHAFINQNRRMEEFNNLFRIKLPDGWEDRTVFTYFGPMDSGVQHNLVVTVDPKPKEKKDLTQYVRSQIGQNESRFPGFTMIAEREKALPSGFPAYEIVYKYCPAEGKVVFQKQVFILAEEKGYILTASFSKKTMKTIAHVVDEMIASFSPIEMEE